MNASEMAGFALEAAGWNFPLAAARIDQLKELLGTGLFLHAYNPALPEPTAAEKATAEHTAEDTAEAIVDELIYGVPPQLAAFLSAGQPPEVVEQINGWLALVTTSPIELAARAALQN